MEEFLYLKIYNDLKDSIISGDIENGSKLPTEKQLGEKYAVSRITAIKAMQKLENEGYIKRVRGSGTFVTYNDVSTFSNSGISLNMNSKNIAFVADCSLDIVFYILSCFQKIAISHGYNVSIFDTSSSSTNEDEILQTVSTGNFCGIVCRPKNVYSNIPVFLSIINRKIPLVFVDSNIPMLRVPCVTSNNFIGGYMITNLLIEYGHRDIAVLFSDFTNLNEQERFGGYVRALSEHKIDFKSENLLISPKDEGDDGMYMFEYSEMQRKESHIGFKEKLNSVIGRPNAPTAIFCMYDKLASFVEQYAIELGCQIPERLSIVGYNNASICEQMIIPLTSVDQNYNKIAGTAFDIILDMIGGKKAHLQNLIEPMLCKRKSLINQQLP